MDSPIVIPVKRVMYHTMALAAAVSFADNVHTMTVAGLPLRVYGWADAVAHPDRAVMVIFVTHGRLGTVDGAANTRAHDVLRPLIPALPERAPRGGAGRGAGARECVDRPSREHV